LSSIAKTRKLQNSTITGCYFSKAGAKSEKVEFPFLEFDSHLCCSKPTRQFLHAVYLNFTVNARQCDNYNLRWCNSMSRMNLSGYV